MKKGMKLFLTLVCCFVLTFAMNVSANEVDPGTGEGTETPVQITSEGTATDGLYYVKDSDGSYVPAEGIVLSVEDSYYHYYVEGKARTTEGATLENKDGHYYLFGASGKAATGLKQYNGIYYFFNKAGQGYAPGDKGMKKIDSFWYYFASNGKAYTKKLKSYKDHYYYFGASGQAKTGKQKIDGVYYLFGSDGTGKAGWITVSSNKYYAKSTGKTATGWLAISGYYYYFDKTSGIMQKSKMVEGYKLDSYGRCKAKYLILQTVKQYTTSSMTKDQKIKALWNFMMNSTYKYVRNNNHLLSTWKWPAGWTTDYAANYYANKGGNCFGYAATFGYLVKEATGYSVRVYHGSTPAARGGLTPHGWTCVNIGGKWYAYDPDMWKFEGHRSIYYKTLYSTTSRSVHFNGIATNLY